MARVYLGIGSNLGERKRNIQKAISLLRKEGIKVKKLSSLIETEPQGGPPQRKFLNAALEVNTSLAPNKLLATLKKIERQLGRTDTERNAPRTIDLDILLYDEQRIKTRNLVIPHPRMWERDFVIKPLCEIAPAIVKRWKLSKA